MYEPKGRPGFIPKRGDCNCEQGPLEAHPRLSPHLSLGCKKIVNILPLSNLWCREIVSWIANEQMSCFKIDRWSCYDSSRDKPKSERSTEPKHHGRPDASHCPRSAHRRTYPRR